MILPYVLVAFGIAPRDAEIREMVRRAEADYRAKNWDAASRGFADAYAVDPNPDYLFARAQAERFAGRCNVALELWDRYLAVETEAANITEAKNFRSFCEPSAEAGPASGAGEPAVTDKTPTRTDKTRKNQWFRDPAGGVLVALGGVSAVIGGSLLGSSIGRDRRARSAATEGEYVDAKDAVRTPYIAGVAMLATGGALLVGGLVRWAIVAKRSRGRKRGTTWRGGALDGVAPLVLRF